MDNYNDTRDFSYYFITDNDIEEFDFSKRNNTRPKLINFNHDEITKDYTTKILANKDDDKYKYKQQVLFLHHIMCLYVMFMVINVF